MLDALKLLVSGIMIKISQVSKGMLPDTSREDEGKILRSVNGEWAKSDELAHSWENLEDKPFYSELRELYAADVSFLYTEDDGLYIYMPPAITGLSEGSRCIFNWNGKDYSLTVREVDGILCAGNLSLMRDDVDTGEPFILVYQGGTWLVASTQEGPHRLEITEDHVKGIDAKYLPEGYPSFSIVDEILYEESEIEFTYSGNAEYYTFYTSREDVYKETELIVVFDGVEYPQPKVTASRCIGNSHLYNTGDTDTGEPFCIYQRYTYDTTCRLYVAVPGKHTLKLYVKDNAKEYYPMIKEYLPGSLIMEGAGEYSEIFNYEGNIATGNYSHAEGHATEASGLAAHAEGYFTMATGDYSHAEGYYTKASGRYSHAEGQNTQATGDYSHAEGSYAYATGLYSHAEGSSTQASSYYAHAEGYNAKATATGAHAEGLHTEAGSQYQHVQGKYNIVDTSGKYAHIVGNGTGTSTSKRSNAHTIDWDGNAWFKGKVYIGGTSQADAIELGTGSGLPDITAADNGSFLRVVNGEWTVSSIASAEEASF